eukprot:1159332-Pelagomonas_calceolata.AAC.12
MQGQAVYIALVGKDMPGPSWHMCKLGVEDSVGQMRHMSFLKGTLVVKHATTHWAVLRECGPHGHVPLQFYCFRSAIKMYNGPPHAGPLRSDFTHELRHRLRGAWRVQHVVEGVDLQTTNNRLARYQAIFVLPLDHNECKPIQLPGYLHLDLPRHAMQNVQLS